MAEIIDVTSEVFLPESLGIGLPSSRFSFRQIGSIAKPCNPVNAFKPIKIIEDIFNQDSEVEAVPIENDGCVIGSIDRFEIKKANGNSFKRLFSMQCIKYVKQCPIVIYAREYIQNLEEAIEEANKKYGIFYFPVFERSKKFLGVFSITSMRQRLREIFDRDFENATKQQKELMPSAEDLSHLPFKTTVWTRMANKVGGDLCVIKPMTDTKYIAASFDVSGKNVAAAMVTMTIGAFFSLVKLLNLSDITPDVFVSTFDTYLTDIVKTDTFITAIICFIDISCQQMEVYNCGHTVMYVSDGDRLGNIKMMTKYSPSFAPMGLGSVAEAILTEDPMRNVLKLKIEKGMHVNLISDGFTDMLNDSGARYEEERVRKFLEMLYSCKDDRVSEKIAAAVADWTGKTPLPDDISVMDMRF